MPDVMIQSLMEIEELISKEKKNIIDVKALNMTLNEKRIALEKEHENKLQDLEKQQSRIIEELETKNNDIKQSIVDTDEKTSALSIAYKNKIQKITDKITSLKNARLGYIEEELNEKVKISNRELKEIETQTEELVAKKNDYTAKYNKKINDIDEKYKKLRVKEAETKNELFETRQKFIKEKEELIKNLENERIALIKKNEGIISEAKRSNDEKIREIQEKQKYIIEKRKEELVQLEEQSKLVSYEKERLIKENVDVQNKMSEELSLAEKRFSQEIDLLNNENDRLRRDLLSAENELMKLAEANTIELQKKKDEYQEYLKFLGDKKKAKIDELNDKLSSAEIEQKEKLSNFINNLDEEYNRLVVENNRVVDELREKLKEDKAIFEEKIANDNDIYNAKNRSLQESANSVENEIEQLKLETSEIVNDYEVKIREMEEELTVMENNNKTELEKLTAEYKFLMQESKLKHEKKCASLREKVDETNTKITELNNDVEDVRKDLQNFIDILNNKRNILVNNHNENLARITAEKQRLNERIEQIKAQMQDDIAKQSQAIVSIGEKRDQSLADYENSIVELENIHKVDMERIHAENEKRVESAKENYEIRVQQLQNDTERLKGNILAEIENKKKDYAEQNEKLAQLHVQLKDEFDKRVANAKAQRESLLEKIDLAKSEYEESLNSYNESRAQIAARLANETNKLKEEQAEKLREMVVTFELVPTQELEAARKELEIKRVEHDKEIESIKVEKEKREKEYVDLENAHNAIRIEAEETLKDVEKTYKNFVEEREEKLVKLTSELENKQAEIKAQNERLEKDIQEIKNNHIVEENNLTEQLQFQYEDVRKALQTKYDIAQRQCEQEIDARKDDLAIKLKDYDEMIAEAGKKKAKLEEEYSAKFDDENRKTKAIQQQLDEQIEHNKNQSDEWKRLLAVKKDEIDFQLSMMKEQYAQIVGDKRVEYEKHIADVKNKINSIKAEMINYDADKEAKLSELTAYKNKVDSEVANIKSITDNVVNEISIKTKELARDAAALEATYKQKEDSIKRQIDEAIKELLVLEKSRPSIIQDEIDYGANQLLIKTQDFKNKLAELNKSNQEILSKLEFTKQQTIDQISLEISELVNGKRDTLNTHTEELDNIARTYEKLLREEKQRQLKVEEQIKKARMDRNEEYNKFILDNNAVSSDFDNAKLSLENEFNNKSLELSEEYKPQVIELTKELLNLESNKTVVISDIKDIKDQFDRKSEELEESKSALLKEYADKMNDINESYENAINENREKLKSDDAINGVILDIFKK